MPSDWSKLRCRNIGFRTGAAVHILVLMFCFLPAGCVFCDAAALLLVRGKLLEADSNEPVSGAAIGGRTFTDGEETDYSSAIMFDGTSQGPLSGEDGTFEEQFVKLGPCGNTAPKFPRPDRVEIIVVRDGCEQSFFVDINENTTADVADPDLPYADVLELKDPILVPPCPQ